MIPRRPVGLLAAALLAAGCGRAPADPAVLRVTIGSEPEALDPALARSTSAVFACRQVFEGLLDLSPSDLSPVPAAAKSFEVSDGGRTWRFALADRRWSDGSPVVAGDFERAWRRVLDPKVGAPYAYLLFGIRGARALYRGEAGATALGIETPDPRTLVVRLEQPNPSFAALLAFPTFFPVPASAGGDASWTAEGRIVSNGPYRLAAREPQRSLDLEANPAYGGAPPSFRRVRLLVLEDASSAVQMFRNGEADWVRDLPSAQIAALKALPGFRAGPFLGTCFYRVNVRRRPYGDPRVRRALGGAIDRARIAERLLAGGEKPADSFVPAAMPGYRPPAAPTFDPDAARRALAEAGFPGGQGFPAVEILFASNDSNRRVAEAVRGMWRRHLGIESRLKPLEGRAALERTQRGDYDVARSSWVADVPDPMNFLEVFESGAGNNRTGWADPEYDRLLADARAEPDAGRRAGKVARAEAILLERGPILPIHVQANQALVAPGLLGVESNPLNHQLLKRLRRAGAGGAP